MREPAGFGERNGWFPATAMATAPETVRDRTAVLRLEREVWDSTAEGSSSSVGDPAKTLDTLTEGLSSSTNRLQGLPDANMEELSPSPMRRPEHTTEARENLPRSSRRIEELDAFAHQLELTRSQQPRRAVQAYQPSALGGNASARGGPQRPGTSYFAPIHQYQDTVQRLRDEYGSQYQPNTSRMVAPRDRPTSRLGLESRHIRTHREHEERLRRHQREEHQSFLQRHVSSTPQPSETSETSQPFNFNPQTGDRGEFIPGAGRWVSDRRSRLQRQREGVLGQRGQPSSQVDGSAEDRSVE